jgi:hypothetical protein
LDQVQIAVLLQLHPDSESQVAAATFAGDDDVRRVDAERVRVA